MHIDFFSIVLLSWNPWKYLVEAQGTVEHYLKITIVKHDVSLTTANHAGSLFEKYFPSLILSSSMDLKCRPRHLTMVQNYEVRPQKSSCS
ncbi:hypothetical protein TNCV_1180621 [Trichonephila clavipes]|nr:hypothetical protein TNCV_1180621 [Trichonephila clavipes]